MSILTKRVLKRFVRGFLSGAFSATVIVVPMTSYDFAELKLWLFRLAFAFIVGGITGALQAGDLYWRNKDDKKQQKPAN